MGARQRMTKMNDKEIIKFLKDSLVPPKPMEGRHGESDGEIITFSDRIMGMTTDFTLVDYGCGKGRLLYGLSNLDTKLLKHLTYIGIDNRATCRKSTSKSVKELGFRQKVKKIKIMKPEEFALSEEKADFIFMINVLHEIHLLDVPSVIESLHQKLKTPGLLVIHEMEELIHGEKGFVSWSGNDLKELFDDETFDIQIYRYHTKSGARLVNAYLGKKVDKQLDEPLDRCYDLYNFKLTKVNNELAEIKKSGKSSKNSQRYLLRLILKDNLESQLRDYEIQRLWQRVNADWFENDWMCLPFFRCDGKIFEFARCAI
jgi:SAM-dependent methyltransferase